MASQVEKLSKKLAKLEEKFEDAPPLVRKRLMKSYLATEKKLNNLLGRN